MEIQKLVHQAQEAIAETKMGRLDHKIGKNEAMATNIYAALKGKKSVGIISQDKETGIVEIAHPVGVIGSVTPTTNPTITPLGNGLMALKGRNAMIVSPHPRALQTTTHTVNIMRDALGSVGAPPDLLQIIAEPSVEKSQELMRSVDVIVATGGPGMVKAAYSSGKPAFGVGPGNVQLIMDEDFDAELAANLTVIGRSFDNGIVCACTQSLIYPIGREQEIVAKLKKYGAYCVEAETDVDAFRTLMFDNKGIANPAVIGQDPHKIAKMVGLDIAEETQIIALKVKGYGSSEILSKEKMCPVLILIPYTSFDEAVAIAKANLNVEGRGHSAGIFTHDPNHANRLGLELPVSRIVVNQPTIDAGGSPHNGLNPTVSLGCGTWGNNSISENLTYKHLLNISRVASYVD